MDAILDWTHETRSVPETGLSVVREATAEERAALAEASNVEGCSRLVATYTIKPIGMGRYRLKGNVAIDVTQACVVTVEPLQRTYKAPLDLELWPADMLTSDTEIDSLEADPEPIEDGRIDIGRIVYEELAGAIDPYPRKDGANFEWEEDAPPAATNPFAALARLRDKDN